uniref:Retrotransposon gag domain-containing protein n=1 Tax=Chenopodium quinoa TaxID=63459 RepID=A0A803N4M8_CHEQI
MEIALSSKKNLGSVTGSVQRSAFAEDTAKAKQWDTCNSMRTWVQLEKRFSMSNGFRKYKLNRDIYSLKQNNEYVNVYYTCLTSLWEELDAMNVLPTVSESLAKVRNLLNVISKFQEDSGLFQFLNGLYVSYGVMRSQILTLTHLSSVDFACSMLQQEESHREILDIVGIELGNSAMYSRNQVHRVEPRSCVMYSKTLAQLRQGSERNMTCRACGGKGQSQSRCWTIVRYPKWHHKKNSASVKNAGKPQGQKWSSVKSSPKLAAIAHTTAVS